MQHNKETVNNDKDKGKGDNKAKIIVHLKYEKQAIVGMRYEIKRANDK